MEEKTGFMDWLASLVTDFDMSNFIPELNTVMGWIELTARLSILVGPIVMLVLGVIYFFFPPQEANHSLGYRFYWGMGSVDAWRFTQKLAGASWIVLGALLSVIMLVISLIMGMQAMQAMVNCAAICLVIELVLIGLCCLAIDAVVMLRYDRDGNVRPNTVIRIPDNFLELKFLKKREKKAGKEGTV